jgi:putative exporter of polyketide antibiotics
MNSQPASQTKSLWAFGLGVVTLLCTLGWYLSFALVCIELKLVGNDDPPFFPGIIMVFALIVTLPIALICTAVSMWLVGPRRCKLAWISLCIYLLPLVIAALLKLISIGIR